MPLAITGPGNYCMAQAKVNKHERADEQGFKCIALLQRDCDHRIDSKCIGASCRVAKWQAAAQIASKGLLVLARYMGAR